MPKRVAIDPWKLIEAAEDFARTPSRGRPRPILLRRAVSTAYYALYHYLSRAVAEHILPSGSKEDQLKLTRLFRHDSMKSACTQVAGRGKSNEHLDPLVGHLQDTPLSDVASVFCDLQEARHRADYDHLETFSKQGTVGLIRDAKKALHTLENADASDREAFFALLVMTSR